MGESLVCMMSAMFIFLSDHLHRCTFYYWSNTVKSERARLEPVGEARMTAGTISMKSIAINQKEEWNSESMVHWEQLFLYDDLDDF